MLYDTPGVVLSHRLNMLLDGEDLRRINPTKPLEMLRPVPFNAAPASAEGAHRPLALQRAAG